MKPRRLQEWFYYQCINCMASSPKERSESGATQMANMRKSEKHPYIRVDAKTPAQLMSRDFLLNVSNDEFDLLKTAIERLMIEHRFVWNPCKLGSFEADLKYLCYKIPCDEKKVILNATNNVMNDLHNWAALVNVAISIMIISSKNKRVTSPWGFTVWLMKHPHEIIRSLE